MRRRYEHYFDRHRLDAIAFPTTLVPATPIGEDEYIDLAGRRAPTAPTFVHNTGPSSIVGLPGLTLPAGQSASKLPVGLEPDGRAGHDDHLLSIGLAWEDYRQEALSG